MVSLKKRYMEEQEMYHASGALKLQNIFSLLGGALSATISKAETSDKRQTQNLKMNSRKWFLHLKSELGGKIKVIPPPESTA